MGSKLIPLKHISLNIGRKATNYPSKGFVVKFELTIRIPRTGYQELLRISKKVISVRNVFTQSQRKSNNTFKRKFNSQQIYLEFALRKPST